MGSQNGFIEYQLINQPIDLTGFLVYKLEPVSYKGILFLVNTARDYQDFKVLFIRAIEFI